MAKVPVDFTHVSDGPKKQEAKREEVELAEVEEAEPEEDPFAGLKDSDFDNEVARKLRERLINEEVKRRYNEMVFGAVNFDDQFLNRDELKKLPGVESLIDGVMNRDSLIMLSGRNGSHKTFLAVDWSLCLATGTAWNGRATEKVKVMYVVGEGASGINQRVEAWEQEHGIQVDRDQFVVRKSAVNLYLGGPDFMDLLQRIERGGFGLVVFDTLRRMSGGADENSSNMGLVIDNMDRIKQVMDRGSVLVPAHTDKLDNKTRGFSGVDDDSDIVWRTKFVKHTRQMTLSHQKMKDGPELDDMVFVAKPVARSLVLDWHPEVAEQQTAEDNQMRELRDIVEFAAGSFEEDATYELGCCPNAAPKVGDFEKCRTSAITSRDQARHTLRLAGKRAYLLKHVIGKTVRYTVTDDGWDLITEGVDL